MAHDRLFPEPGHPFLSPAEAVDRLRMTFTVVEADWQRGAEHVKAMVEQFRRLKDLTPPPATEEQIVRLEGLKDEAVFIVLRDREESESAFLTTCLIPGEPLFFGYSSSEHEQAAKPLLGRCAATLGYDAEGE